MKVFASVLGLALVLSFSSQSQAAGPFQRLFSGNRVVSSGGHNGMVRQSGITPHQVGSHEGVGMSSRSYEDAVRNACYWGKRTPVSIQYNQRGGMYYAVVRYN